jgi:hypothetical protein
MRKRVWRLHQSSPLCLATNGLTPVGEGRLAPLQSPIHSSDRKTSAILVSTSFASILTLCAISCAQAQAVITGHYVPGIAGGLNSGMLAPPGFYLDNATYYYHADTFRDENGDRLPFNVELNVIANRTSALWVSAWTLLHATYGAGIAFPVSNFAPNPISIEGESADGSLGLGDIAVQPFIFGWHFRQFHYLASFTLFTPTGRFKQGATNNTGKGFWTNMLSAGATWVSPDSAPWSISAIGRYEIPTKQEGADIYPGQTATIEWGLGKRLTNAFQLGTIGYFWRQTTLASGSDAPPGRYEAVALGAECQYNFSRNLIGKLRAFDEFAAWDTSEGPGAVLSFTYVLP